MIYPAVIIKGDMRTYQDNESLTIRILWTLSTTVGFTIAPALAFYIALLLTTSPTGAIRTLAITDAVVNGILTGFLQWFLLRQRSPRTHNWSIGTIVGFVLGTILGHTPPFSSLGPLVRASLLGASIGIAQGLSVDRNLAKSWRWVLFNILGWALGDAIGGLFSGSSVKFFYFPVVGLIVGLVTGEALIRTFRNHEWL